MTPLEAAEEFNTRLTRARATYQMLRMYPVDALSEESKRKLRAAAKEIVDYAGALSGLHRSFAEQLRAEQVAALKYITALDSP